MPRVLPRSFPAVHNGSAPAARDLRRAYPAGRDVLSYRTASGTPGWALIAGTSKGNVGGDRRAVAPVGVSDAP
ncbi:hypothetical protein RHRU231_30010 [Rhodococcus ruber]|uniref:Uncharacterized protein n=1 Tax=Rhodococcus ruber TaxID=1830 RepID=A0A098BH09_9NOCA|nr:hypothetical protein RHRU231_30010 [Rhodococcus ruber]